ncbi:hypothetical protein F5Y14DRAFT_326889 [Nemania sp. NC0429]|nr:hypothetical protein F5Y14DRAFT_326889 [Nemania sp. NC0429]
MSSLFCCAGIKPYKPSYLQHQSKFADFTTWAQFPKESARSNDEIDLDEMRPEFVVQLVRQVNYGPLEATRYFAKTNDHARERFVEIGEQALIQANFKKLNSYKNFKCEEHDKFFEVNLYQKDPVNSHHWRANIARPASQIDL